MLTVDLVRQWLAGCPAYAVVGYGRPIEGQDCPLETCLKAQGHERPMVGTGSYTTRIPSDARYDPDIWHDLPESLSTFVTLVDKLYNNTAVTAAAASGLLEAICAVEGATAVAQAS